jgi:AAA+ superfamily predicted ATPase
MDSSTFKRLFKSHKKKTGSGDFHIGNESDPEQVFSRAMVENADSFWRAHEGESFAFLVSRREKTKLTIGVATFRNGSEAAKGDKGLETAESLAAKFLLSSGIAHSPLKAEETTLANFVRMIRGGYQNDYLEDDDDAYGIIGAGSLIHCMREQKFTEYLDKNESGEVPSKEDLIERSIRLHCGSSLQPELERIYRGAAVPVSKGHPVHYVVKSDSPQIRLDIVKVLYSALRMNGRVQNGRFCAVNCDNVDPDDDREIYDRLFSVNEGGMVVLDYSQKLDDDDQAVPGVGNIKGLCDTAKKHKNEVLTVLCLPDSDSVQESFLENLDGISFIPIKEEPLFGDKAKQYLRASAKAVNITPDKLLYAPVKDPEKGYLAADLNREFENWFDKALKNRVYPQYNDLADGYFLRTACKPKGSAYRELDAMIGLVNAKNVIKKAVNYFKAQKIFRDRGMKSDNTAMHMIFTGNPGSAKTTVARLFAQIMKENGLLSAGNLIEVGRGDLVGQYVGWTAPIVKKKFREAKGSVLFIDEAYSLVDDRSGSYGDEAINTIVQEMENNRTDMVVIFAGYPGKMEGFLSTNPGLRSRIAFHVPFMNYSPGELYEILEFMARDKEIGIAPDVREKVASIFDRAVKSPDFGNGRFVRNLFEQARMSQADRLIAMNPEDITDAAVRTLLAEDFETPMELETAPQTIGFI